MQQPVCIGKATLVLMAILSTHNSRIGVVFSVHSQHFTHTHTLTHKHKHRIMLPLHLLHYTGLHIRSGQLNKSCVPPPASSPHGRTNNSNSVNRRGLLFDTSSQGYQQKLNVPLLDSEISHLSPISNYMSVKITLTISAFYLFAETTAFL